MQGEGWARRFATGLPCRARCAVSSLRAGIPRASARKLAARSACQGTACGGRGLAGGCSTARPSARAVRCGPGTGSSLRCGPHHFPDLHSGALAVSAPVLGREAASPLGGGIGHSSRRRPIVPHVLSAPTPKGVLRFAPAGTRRATALARLVPSARATVAQSLRSLRPHHSRTPMGHALRPRWRPCARVNQ